MYRKILVNVQKVILDYIVNFVSKTNNDWNLNIIYNEYIFFFFFLAKCVIPCLNGGKCKGNNVCRCPAGFKGDHCEIGRRSPQRSACTRACRNGTCQPDNTCLCEPGWFGKLCNKNKPWA